MNKKSQDTRERLDDKKPLTTREIIKTEPPKRPKDTQNCIPLVDAEEIDILALYREWYSKRIDMYVEVNSPFFPIPHFRGDILRYAMENKWEPKTLIQFISQNGFNRPHENPLTFYNHHMMRITGEDLTWEAWSKDPSKYQDTKIIEIKENVGKTASLFIGGVKVGEGELTFTNVKDPEPPKNFNFFMEGTFSVGTNKPTTNEEL